MGVRVPTGHVVPGSAFWTKTRRQDVQMSVCLSVSLRLSPSHHHKRSLSVSLAGQQLPAGNKTSVGLVNALNSSLATLRANTQNRDKGWVFHVIFDTVAIWKKFIKKMYFLYTEEFKAAIKQLQTNKALFILTVAQMTLFHEKVVTQ